MKDAMGLNDTQDSKIRSYAFVISVWDYNFSDAITSELKGVENEQSSLLSFVKSQGFDEALVLENGEANAQTIRKIFTEYYLPKFISASQNGQQIRFMFIFDGHGWQPPSSEATGALALSKLEDEGDLNYDHRFSLAELRGLLADLSPYTRSMVALLGSCYSGSVLRGPGLADDYTPGPSAWIAAAAPNRTQAWILPKESGTLFFQDLISTVDHWSAATSQLPADDTASAVVSFAQFTPKLREIIDRINEEHQSARNPEKPDEPYPPFVMDTVSYEGQRKAAFRFIVPAKVTAANGLDIGNVTLTGSAVVGRPNVTVVHTPEYYSVRGIDLSHASGDVDFQKLKSSGVKFAYLKATQGTKFKDARFGGYLKDATASGLPAGAYHFFDYCEGPDQQFQAIIENVPKSIDLPIAVDLEWKFIAAGGFVKPTDCNSNEVIRENFRSLLQKLTIYYGKMPVITTASAFVKAYPIIDDSFGIYPLWIMDYSKSRVAQGTPSLPIHTPWTFWQYTDHGTFDGIPGKTFDVSVFFGSDQEFRDFASGKQNVALQAALPSFLPAANAAVKAITEPAAAAIHEIFHF
ncbi:hypothetical protein G6K86_30510 [Agrobacterium rhizogenes]|nr:hypothetical protein [Rhizobium rhizogenes]